MRITVGILKGGASRTTTAIYLALAEHARTGEPVLLVDADPANGTAFEWVEDAQEAGSWPEDVKVAYWPLSSLAKRVRAEGVASVVIDTGNDAAALKAALEVTDHLVVPVAPTGTESTRLRPTLEAAADIAQRKQIELSILLTRVRHTRSRGDVREALTQQLGLRVLEAEVPLLERFASAYGTTPADLSPYTDIINELHAIEEES